jgi:hypothetical protein
VVAEAIATTKAVLAVQGGTSTGEIVIRADSAFYARKVIAACRGTSPRAWMSRARQAIDAIPADAEQRLAHLHRDRTT